MSGQVFLFGDDIDTDQLAPGQYMHGGIEMIAAHCLEGVRPEFAANVSPGDVIVELAGVQPQQHRHVGLLGHLCANGYTVGPTPVLARVEEAGRR